MNFPFLAHCHLATTESNITCWAKWYLQGRSGQGNAELGSHNACVSPHPCLLHLFADGFYLHISSQSILFPNECLFSIGAHPAAAVVGGRPEFLRVRGRETLCPGQAIVLSSLSGQLAISPAYSLARGHEF